jgi:pimeloyl-ACP methyl ester carboxylesterase
MAVAVAVVGSLAPYGVEEGFDYFAGMGELNADDIKSFLSDPEAARRRHREEWDEARAATPEQLAEVMKSVLSPEDATAMTGDLAQWLASNTRDGLVAGDQGWWDDAVAEVTSWGFDLKDIRVPVKVWHGRQDRMVPVQHGQWLAANIPGADAEISDRDGHLAMISRIGEIHDWLLQHF